MERKRRESEELFIIMTEQLVGLGLLPGLMVGHATFLKGYPYAIMETLYQRARATNTVNKFDMRLAQLPTDRSRAVVQPAPDLLYLAMFYSVEKYPLRITCVVPDTYWSVCTFSHSTECFWKTNDSRRQPGDRVTIVLIGPHHEMPPPEKDVIIIRSPSTIGECIFCFLVQ